jgi:hypothetical protein
LRILSANARIVKYPPTISRGDPWVALVALPEHRPYKFEKNSKFVPKKLAKCRL